MVSPELIGRRPLHGRRHWSFGVREVNVSFVGARGVCGQMTGWPCEAGFLSPSELPFFEINIPH